MKVFPIILVAALAVTSLQAAPKKILIVTTTIGYRHSSIPTAEKVLAALAKQSGTFTVDFIHQPEGRPDDLEDGASDREKAAFQTAEVKWEEKLKLALKKLSPDSLENYDAVVFVSTTGNLPIPDRQGFLDWIKAGHAFIGIHAASDVHGWPEFIAMLGGEFDHHGPQVSVDCLNRDQRHPACAHLGKTWTIKQEEIFQFKNHDPAKVHDLLILDKNPETRSPGHFPVAWCKQFGKGRVFYTSLGHREDIWDSDPKIEDRKNAAETSKAYQAHILGGINWALGLVDSNQ